LHHLNLNWRFLPELPQMLVSISQGIGPVSERISACINLVRIQRASVDIRDRIGKLRGTWATVCTEGLRLRSILKVSLHPVDGLNRDLRRDDAIDGIEMLRIDGRSIRVSLSMFDRLISYSRWAWAVGRMEVLRIGSRIGIPLGKTRYFGFD
jgi:hypothetical protein